MTGGQMAPTTLVGQTTTTTPWGRRPENEGFPLRVCELLATLEAPVYIERVALSDNKNIMKARKAIRKALELQRDGAGFSLVEILSPCPTIWKMTPTEARDWVAEHMIRNFPLGVFRDRKVKMPESSRPPRRTVAEVLGLADAPAEAETPATRSADAREWKIKIAGFGGQGVLLLGQILAEMGMREGKEVSWLPSYGPEMRSGSAHCHVCLSSKRIGSPLIEHPNVLVAMNEISLRKFAPSVVPGGMILYNRRTVPADVEIPNVRVFAIPASELADQLGAAKVGNIVMLGALLELTGALSSATAETVLQGTVKNSDLLALDLQALHAGRDYVRQLPLEAR